MSGAARGTTCRQSTCRRATTRRDVQRAVHGDAPLVRAVVVGDVDLLDVARSRPCPCTRSPSRSEANVSLVRATPRSARCCWWISSAIVCAKNRGLLAGPLYSRANTDCRDAHVEQPHLDPQAVGGLLHRADDEAVGAELAPAIERHVVERARRRDRRVGVARNQVELALEVQIVPEHLADRLRSRRCLGVGRERDEVGHRVLRRRARLAGDAQFDLATAAAGGCWPAAAGGWAGRADAQRTRATSSDESRTVGLCGISARIGISR